MSEEFTYKEVAERSSKKDLLMVIHDKVYQVASFVDEHPGGEEVMMDVGGQDATEAFEDVGHSDEAREILNGLLHGTLKRMPGDPEPKSTTSSTSSMNKNADSLEGGMGGTMWIVLIMGALLAAAAYYVTLQK